MVNAVLVLASLWTNFVNPPISARPWCYWWWTNGHVDHETITADLESMKALGFGGVLMFDSRGYWDDDEHVRNPPAEVGWGSDIWSENDAFSVRECARLGLGEHQVFFKFQEWGNGKSLAVSESSWRRFWGLDATFGCRGVKRPMAERAEGA